jgi:restriction system protein
MPAQSKSRFIRYMPALIKALQEFGGSARPKQVLDAIQKADDVPREDLENKHKSGQTIFYNDAHWCREYLKQAGYIDSSRRGLWTLTPKGQSCVFTDADAAEVLRAVKEQNRAKPANKPDGEASVGTASVDEDDLPEIDEEDQYREEALKKLQQLSPAAFERFCQRLLEVAGFEEVEVTGRTGDRGIDGRGMLRVNTLFSMRIAFQAKRYQDTVGAAVVRDFRGAIVGRADRGLILTTGTFSRDARTEASRDGAAHIELIDGQASVDLMVEHEFGLKPKQTFEVDEDHFAKFEN